MNEHCNIFNTIQCILENGILAGNYKISNLVRPKMTYYLNGRGFITEQDLDSTVVMNEDGEEIVVLNWCDNGVFLDTKYYKHHIVLEIIVIASELIIREVVDKITEKSEDNSDEDTIEKSEAEEESEDEWL